ncbi:Flp pilus assembly protein CpaB [Sphingomonas carotinifaciens]|uniref:Pilus assembly protein CpaB n=1 Tax=Sphingomonas carotinifaciens TaxID=1166323 RepID=A0A1G7KGG7_9SPHN|nr:Flp pilus assembly protein CpaB [Sphingomonas carotinifaciens]MBB4085258.1 pilus assembly protein CpaB [Sphingomonas carotinifaciens]MWC43717.1 Flp pilus assembly protein CpaB [Sphingomonas carotinifaciens]SDF36245.1 pilus assembly protein CpaB [Sphingomonas carotinifaciens]
MDSRKIILLVGALVVAAVTAFFARTLIAGSAAPQATAAAAAPVIDGPEVLVATRALPVGTILDASALRFQPWPKELVDGAYYLKAQTDLKALQGTVVRNAITAGQPVTQGALVKPGDRGFLAAALGPGMRAVTVPVSAQGSVAGFVFPGDRIDLVLTQEVAGGGDGPALKVSETVMRNVRVLATDQRTDNQVGEDGKTEVRTFSTVTVESTPKMAEQIAVAQTLGTLSLSLRSIADNPAELEEAIASGAVKVPDGADPAAEKAMMLRVASQPQAGSSSYATGADVSRYQRSTVPGRAAGQMGGDAPAVGVGGGTGGGTVATTGIPSGPVIRVARGNNVTAVPVLGK